jgi:hypothetical protein
MQAKTVDTVVMRYTGYTSILKKNMKSTKQMTLKDNRACPCSYNHKY